jgi:hypothetical protein
MLRLRCPLRKVKRLVLILRRKVIPSSKSRCGDGGWLELAAGIFQDGRPVTHTPRHASQFALLWAAIILAVASASCGSPDVTGTNPTLEQVVLAPSSVSLSSGDTQQFNVSGVWSDGSTTAPTVTYSATGGTITSGGLYTAGTTTGTFRVIATQQGGTLADTSTVTITAPVLTQVILTPATVSLAAGLTQQFSVSGKMSDGSTTTPAVTFTATGGSITAGGLYTAGSITGTFRVIATQQGGTLADTSAVTITAAVLTQLILNPSTASIPAGLTQQFSVSGVWSDGSATTPSVTYNVTGGSITAGGLYTAGGTTGTFRVIATQQGGTVADTSTVTITAPVLTQVILTPASVGLPAGGAQQFAVSGQLSDGSTNTPAVTYTATGGTITAAGLYTAGTTTGTFRVIATQQGGTLADTSAVTITSAVLTQVILTPATASVPAGLNQQFSVSGMWSDGSTTPPSVAYTATGGTITSGGLYTAGTTTGTFRVVATQQGGTLADTSTVTITAPVLAQVILTPATADVPAGLTQQFAVSGKLSDGSTTTPAVTYSATGGTITAGGLYTAGTSTGTYQVIATQQGGTIADTSSVTITAPLLTQLILNPSTASIPAGLNQQFSVSGTWSDGSSTTPAVNYTATGGSITTGGLYTAGSTTGTFRVIATQQGGTLADSSTVTITAPVLTQVILTPASVTLAASATQQFAVSGKLSDGSTNTPAVTYSATGGAITTGGLYTAGSTAGTFRVIATQQGGTLADTSTVTIGHSYATNFPLTENPISEGGHWINGGTVGLDWTDVSTTPGLAIGHQCCASYTDATAILTGSWGPDQQASAIVHSINQNDACYQEVELRLRSAISANSNTGYEIGWKASQTGQAYLIIVRWNGPVGSYTYIRDYTTQGSQWGVKEGDTVKATIVGNTISAYKNGVLQATVDITSIGGTVWTSGTPGMGFNLENATAGCPGTNGDYGYTSFAATDAP